MHGVTFLQDLAVVMLVAGVVMVIFRRLRQPVVLGYILAGVIIGPHTPPYALVHDQATINTLSELGVILLMFSLGLEFSLRKLTTVGAPALLAALLEILLLFWVGYEIGRFFDWGTMDSIFLGAMLSMSSTTVIIKVLSEMGKMKEGFAQLVFGILILEDILGIAMIALLSGIAMTGALSLGAVALTLGKLGVFLAVTLVVGLLLVPRLIGYVARFKSNEMLVITVLALCFGVSLLAVKLDYSVALGAFIIGAVIAETREIHRIEALIEPVRDMFSAVFFVAIGLLIDPRMLVTYWEPILLITAAVVLGKVVTCSAGAFLGGNDPRTSLKVGMSLAQIGEFSFIIASLGVTLKVTSSFLYPIAVAVSAITTLLTPYLIRTADGTMDALRRRAPERLTRTLQVYTTWTGQLGAQRNLARSLMWKWSAHLALNAVLIAAVFIGGAFLEAHPPAWFGQPGPRGDWVKPAIWFACVLCSLPMVIASVRKLQAFGLLLAETRVTPQRAGKNTAAIRSVVAAFVPATGSAALGLFVLILSSTLLPSFNVLLVLLALAGVLAWLMWRSFNRAYSSAQAALVDTFAQAPPPKPDARPATETSLLAEADLATLTVAAGSPAAGQLIRETGLRLRTGASIVALERPGVKLVNPGPDEEIHAEDTLLLLGTAAQLVLAKRLLAPDRGGTSS
ncbi:MAG TPA: cation:proton antiporter [Lacunisphaera sp.]|nr:cation:proton antiporter [Lacunisphaera sp.]